MKFILGKKIEMTQIFKEDGTVVPVTMIKAGPCLVTQVKTKEKEKYSAVQIGFEVKKKVKKPVADHLKKFVKQWKGYPAYLKEFRVEDSKLKIGDFIPIDVFQKGDLVQATGTTKGRGFAGVVKRHGFKGGPASHGHKDQLRMPGSIGATEPARVFKGKKMPGRMGARRMTVKNLEVVDVDAKKNLLYLKGAVPGARNSLIVISGGGEMELKNILEEPVKVGELAKEQKPEEQTKEIKTGQEPGKKVEEKKEKKEQQPDEGTKEQNNKETEEPKNRRTEEPKN